MSRQINAKTLEAAEAIVNYSFKNKDILRSALTHPSASEGLPVGCSYERLEFLGDSILGAIVARDLYEAYPEADEGKLTRLKVALVSGKTLSKISKKLRIGELILFGESELGTGSRGMNSALENVYESLVGALYLDGGMNAAESFVRSSLNPRTAAHRALFTSNPKTMLQECLQRDRGLTPHYKLVSEEGPAHNPSFVSVAMIENERAGRGTGSSKKEAESEAALDALIRLNYVSRDADDSE